MFGFFRKKSKTAKPVHVTRSRRLKIGSTTTTSSSFKFMSSDNIKPSSKPRAPEKPPRKLKRKSNLDIPENIIIRNMPRTRTPVYYSQNVTQNYIEISYV